MIEHRTTCPNTPSPMRPAAYIADMLMEIALQFEAAHFSQIRGQNLMTFPAGSSIYSTNTRSTETRLSERRTRKPIDRCPAHWPRAWRAWRAFLRSLIVATDASCFLALCSQSLSFVRPRRWLSSVPTTAAHGRWGAKQAATTSTSSICSCEDFIPVVFARWSKHRSQLAFPIFASAKDVSFSRLSTLSSTSNATRAERSLTWSCTKTDAISGRPA